ncbi:MAG: hypothetical protein IJ038_06700 [Clostridia bacterium]|nr:hypothetical protein [Clostridia bacterium]
MYEFTPQKSNKAAQYTSLILIITSVLAMFFSNLPNLPYRSVMQLAALFALSVALMLLGRYVFKGYVYAVIENDDGGYDFTVTEIKRKSRITVCRIGLSGIEEAVIVKKSDKKELSQKASGRKAFNYCVDMSPEEYCCILCEECGEKLLIKIQPDERLFGILSGK